MFFLFLKVMVVGKILNVDGEMVAIHIKCREENPLLIQKYAHTYQKIHQRQRSKNWPSPV